MILPSKHISEEQALLGVGAELLRQLGRAETTTSLWERVRERQMVGTFERFVLALNMLHILGIVDIHSGIIERTRE